MLGNTKIYCKFKLHWGMDQLRSEIMFPKTYLKTFGKSWGTSYIHLNDDNNNNNNNNNNIK